MLSAVPLLGARVCSEEEASFLLQVNLRGSHFVTYSNSYSKYPQWICFTTWKSMMQDKPTHQNIEEPSSPIVEQAQQEVARGSVPWYRASKRAQAFILLYLVEFVLFTLLALFVHFHPVDAVDIAISREFQENHAAWLQTSMIAVSYLGYHFFLFSALILLTAVVFWLVRLRLEALLIVTLSAVSSALNFGMKVLVNRPRPTANLVDVVRQATGQSFPSGHVMSYVAYFGLLFSLGVILLKRDRWWHYLVLIIPALFVILVGPSRIYLGAHWGSDVLGAYLLGAFLLGIALWIYLVLKTRGIVSPELKPGETLVAPLLTRRKPGEKG